MCYLKQDSIDNGNKAAPMKRFIPPFKLVGNLSSYCPFDPKFNSGLKKKCEAHLHGLVA